jgi:serine/threonine protein phosphatase PrpC
MSATESVGAASAPGDCRICHAPVFEHECFCEVCGARLTIEPVAEPETAPATGPMQRAEHDLGVAAGVSDRGYRRSRNEDAMGLAAFEVSSAVVVCDGVASTADAHRASQVASDVSIGVLEAALRQPPADHDAWHQLFLQACEEAQAALAHVVAEGGDLSPSTTLVAAVSVPGVVSVANIGDSRAYLLDGSPGGGRLLTVDDSWAEEMIAEGVPPQEAYADPEAHTITRWLGADAESVDPTVTTVEIDSPGVVVVCSDGLWDYFDRPSALAELVDGAVGVGPLGLARRLVDAALAAGGHDNVTVAVVPVAPVRPGATPNIATMSEE